MQWRAACSFYATQSCTRVLEAVNRCFPQAAFDDPAHMSVIYADARHACDAPDRIGAGAARTTIMPIQDLQGMAGKTSIINDCGDVNKMTGPAGVSRWIGGLAHKFGHTIGLPHPPVARQAATKMPLCGQAKRASSRFICVRKNNAI